MHTLPANFLTRDELHRLVERAAGLQSVVTDATLVAALQTLVTAAATLDGVLDDLPITQHPVDKALVNTGEWSTFWAGQGWDFKPGRVRVDRQYLSNGRVNYPTSRYRVGLGPVVHVSVDREYLHNQIVRFLMADWDELPSRLIDACFASLEG